MEPTTADWARVADAIENRMAELSLGPADVKAKGGPSDKPLAGYLRGNRIVRKDVKRGLCSALKWPPNGIDRILLGEDPAALVAAQDENVAAMFEAIISRLDQVVGILRGREAR